MEWKNDPQRMPLVIRGTRQIEKTDAVLNFEQEHYKHLININFAIDRKFQDIFKDGYGANEVI